MEHTSIKRLKVCNFLQKRYKKHLFAISIDFLLLFSPSLQHLKISTPSPTYRFVHCRLEIDEPIDERLHVGRDGRARIVHHFRVVPVADRRHHLLGVVAQAAARPAVLVRRVVVFIFAQPASRSHKKTSMRLCSQLKAPSRLRPKGLFMAGNPAVPGI